MLVRRDFTGLADRFGYALAFGRAPSAAIEADFNTAVASGSDEFAAGSPSIALAYFKPNDTGLIASIDCTLAVGDEASVFLSLVVTGEGEDRYVTLEDISGSTR